MGHNNAIMNLLCRILFIASFQVVQSRVLTQLSQEDYTLYFDEYRFDWSNTEDWNIITPQNTPYSEIIACTLPIQVIKKNVCVQTKSEGGFTLTFDDIPNSNSNASYIDESNDFESFLRSDDDIYNIELDYLNDDHWNEISTIWNWNTQQMNANRMYQEHAQSPQYHVRRRLRKKKKKKRKKKKKKRLRQEQEQLGLGLGPGLGGEYDNYDNGRRRRRRRRRRRMNPMMRMMTQMNQIAMMMKMINQNMPGARRQRRPCSRSCDSPCGGYLYGRQGCARVEEFDDYLHEYDAFYGDEEDYDDDDAFRYVRRLMGTPTKMMNADMMNPLMMNGGGELVKKCRALKNGLGICATYDEVDTHLVVDVKTKRDYDGDTDAMGDKDEWMRYFDTLELNWNDEDSWSDVDTVNRKSSIQFGQEVISMDMGIKCSHTLPFLNFKLCCKVSDHDIVVFFQRTKADEGLNWYGMESDWNDVQQIIEKEFEEILFRFSNDEDWHAITTTHMNPASITGERCHFLYIAKICLGLNPNRMQLKLSIQFESAHKWKDIVIKHLSHKVTSPVAKVVDERDDVMDVWHGSGTKGIDGYYEADECIVYMMNLSWVDASEYGVYVQ
eukprot:73369_1